MKKPSIEFFDFEKFYIPRRPVVYFLIVDNEVKYVGKSHNIYTRLGRHMTLFKNIDKIYFQEVDREDVDRFEAFFISHFQPEWNRYGKR